MNELRQTNEEVVWIPISFLCMGQSKGARLGTITLACVITSVGGVCTLVLQYFM